MLHGHTVYFGPSTKMMPYFMEHGYSCKTQDNPADFALDLLSQATGASAIDVLCENYRSSSTYIHTPAISSDTVFSHEVSRVQKSHGSFGSNFFYVCQRTFRVALRNSALLTWQIAVAIILGVLTGFLYYQIPRKIGSGVQNRLGGIFFIVVNQIFSTATALEPFIKERALFIHVGDT